MEKPLYTTQNDELLFASIGRLTISWAVLEVGLDFVIIILHDFLGGAEIEKEKPWALQRKLDFARKCFRRLPHLSSLKETAADILREIEDESEMRHDIVHGVATSHPEGAREIEMMRLLRGKSPKEAKRYSVDATQILRAAVSANKLGRRTLRLGESLKAIVDKTD